MRRLFAALVALALGLVLPSQALPARSSTLLAAPRGDDPALEAALGALESRAAAARGPREELESLTLLAALSMLHILEREGRFTPYPSDPDGGERATDEHWIYAGEKVAIVREEDFPEYFALERCQRELGLFVGADEEELDRRLAGWRVPRALSRGAERLAERARLAG